MSDGKRFSRREFLKSSTAAGVGAAVGMGVCAGGSLTASPRVLRAENGTGAMIYFFDDEPIRKMEGLSRIPGPVEKLGPVLEPTSSDGDMCASFASSVVELDDRRWRLYYTFANRAAGRQGIGVAESQDGLHWARPLLGQVKRDGKDTNQLFIEGLPDDAARSFHGQPQVLRLPDGSWLMYFWVHGGYLRYSIARSEDGLHWRVDDFDRPAVYHPHELNPHGFTMGFTPEDLAGHKRFGGLSATELLRLKALRSNDATYVYYNADLRRFEMYSVWLMFNPEDGPRSVSYDNAPQALRTIHRRLSGDGVSWSDPELIITPDDADPMDQQFYYLAVHWQDGWHIGMLGNYPVADQTMDVELCFSRDGRQWSRPIRTPWLPRGPEKHDSLMVYAPNRLIDAGEHWLLLYTGSNHLHNASRPEGSHKPRSVTCAARFPKRRFLGLRAQGSGQLWTRPFIPKKREIRLDAAISGQVRAELCDPYGTPLPGLSRVEAVPLTGDSTEHVLRWKDGNSARYQYDAVSLRLAIADATVYAIEA